MLAIYNIQHFLFAGEAIKLQISPGQIWYNVNELDSKMTIESVDYKTGVFGGSYVSGVGEVDKVGYPLTGCFDTDGIAIGWAVNWKNEGMNAHSVTTWSGKLQKTNSGNPVIQTTWLLTAQTLADVNWKSTEVGSDHFCLTPI